MSNCLRNLIYLILGIGFSICHAGSFEDFFAAIKRDDATVVSRLLQLGFDPNTPSPDGIDPLFLALREPSLKVADVLIGWPKTRVETRNSVDESPLMMAALKGHLTQVRRLLARDADVNKPGWTPLHYAATGGHVEVIRELLNAHAYIDAESPNRTTPLMMAARYGSAAAVRALLESGADPTLRNDQGLTAVDFAFRASRQDMAALIAAAAREWAKPAAGGTKW